MSVIRIEASPAWPWRRISSPDELLRHPSGSAKIPSRVERVGRMYSWTRVAAIGDAAGVPESPSCCSCCAWNSGGGCLEEVELVCRVFVHSTADEDEES